MSCWQKQMKRRLKSSHRQPGGNHVRILLLVGSSSAQQRACEAEAHAHSGEGLGGGSGRAGLTRPSGSPRRRRNRP